MTSWYHLRVEIAEGENNINQVNVEFVSFESVFTSFYNEISKNTFSFGNFEYYRHLKIEVYHNDSLKFIVLFLSS